MQQFKPLIVLMLGVLVTSCNEYRLIGNWQRLDLAKYNLDSVNSTVKRGDMNIFDDSTFFIKGSPLAGNSNIPGWNFSGDTKGTWSRPDKNHIILKEYDYSFPLIYKIIKLDKNDLIIVSTLDTKKATAYYLKYKRR
jgi:hypothetical protein